MTKEVSIDTTALSYLVQAAIEWDGNQRMLEQNGHHEILDDDRELIRMAIAAAKKLLDADRKQLKSAKAQKSAGAKRSQGKTLKVKSTASAKPETTSSIEPVTPAAHRTLTRGMVEAMTTLDDVVAKAIAICEQYRDGLIDRDKWHRLMSEIHHKDCGGDPVKSGWIMHECHDLVSDDDWDWSCEQDADEYCKLQPEDDRHIQQSLFT